MRPFLLRNIICLLLLTILLCESCSSSSVESPKQENNTFAEKIRKGLDALFNKKEEGRVLGLIDYLLTPNRVTRNIVSWFLSGVSFFGVLVQGDTFYRAIKQHQERKEEEEAAAAEAAALEAAAAGGFFNPFQKNDVEPSSFYPTFARRTNVVEEFGSPKEPKRVMNNKLKKKYWRHPKMPNRKYDPRKFFARSSNPDIENRVMSLRTETCIRKGLCRLFQLAKTSNVARNFVSQLRSNKNFEYFHELEDLSTLGDCDNAFSDCTISSNEISRILFQ